MVYVKLRADDDITYTVDSGASGEGSKETEPSLNAVSEIGESACALRSVWEGNDRSLAFLCHITPFRASLCSCMEGTMPVC